MDAINLFEPTTAPAAELIRAEAKKILEALLFSAHEPVRFEKLREVIDAFHPIRPRDLRELLRELGDEYGRSERAIQLDEVGGGYLLRTKEAYASYVQLLHVDRRPERLSRAALEVLAIIAYRQPITRPAIDALRGVDSSGTLAVLLERQLVERAGRAEGPGRPTLYTTTDRFLRQFGLSSLEELPGLDKKV